MSGEPHRVQRATLEISTTRPNGRNASGAIPRFSIEMCWLTPAANFRSRGPFGATQKPDGLKASEDATLRCAAKPPRSSSHSYRGVRWLRRNTRLPAHDSELTADSTLDIP